MNVLCMKADWHSVNNGRKIFPATALTQGKSSRETDELDCLVMIKDAQQEEWK